MPEQIYFEALERIQRRLSQPRILTAHALLFGVITSIAGISNLFSYGYIDGATYWGIFVWCLVLLGHGAYSYWRSGAQKNRRDQVIQEELLQYADEFSTDELVDLHERLSDEVQRRLTPLYWTLAVAVGYSGLWQGMLLGALVLNGFFAGIGTQYFTMLAQLIPLVGTMFLTIGLTGIQILLNRKQDDGELRTAYLRALYATKASKRKRLANERLVIDDEGEIVREDEQAGKQSRPL